MSRSVAQLFEARSDRLLSAHLADIDEEMDLRDEAYDELVGLSQKDLSNACSEVASYEEMDELIGHALAENGQGCIEWGQRMWERMLRAKVREKREQERKEHEAYLAERFAKQQR